MKSALKNKTKYIFVIGGVVSGLGKGTVAASIGLLLKSSGFKVTHVKIDPYLNVDAGTMRPAEHGETFVTEDGGEIDQDMGNYERFLNQDFSKENNITSGKVFQTIIANERAFKYEGRDVEMIPDVPNEIKRRFRELGQGFDFVVVEVGGTTGDIENMPFLWAAREMKREAQTMYVMVSFVPFLRNVGELKTKPTQQAMANLRATGIMADILITRNEIPIDRPRLETLAKRCFVDDDAIFDDPDCSSIYEVPMLLEKQGLVEKIWRHFGIKSRKTELKEWKKMVKMSQGEKGTVKIALVGKYVKHGGNNHRDVYVSVLEALKHGGIANGVKVEIVPISADDNVLKTLSQEKFRGVVVPQGWGSRGVEGILVGVRWARENKVPYLGLCFGMQMAVIEFARNVVGLKGANSEEVDSKTKYPVIHVMPEQKKYLEAHQYGGTIRLGSWPCLVKDGSILNKIYGKSEITERHRHRYEFNNEFREKLENLGLVISGVSPDGKLVEAIEVKGHPFFVGTQFHPEYKSRPDEPASNFCRLC